MPGPWWYCLKHNAVEGPDGCPDADRMGPYGSPEEAGRALQAAAEKSESWDRDPRWNDEADSRDGP
jgi:hypothetical protein